MWTLEVYTRDVTHSYRIVSKEIFEGFASRREAENKIDDYYESEMNNPKISYSFFLVSPHGTAFPVDIFGTAYMNMILGEYKDIL